MRLYYHPMSSNARRAMLAALHLGLKLDLIETNLMSADDRRRLAELNPNGMVPVLEDDGFVLWESCAIMQYLADCTPGQSLYPQDATVRADVNRWMFWAAQHFGPAIGALVWENVWKEVVTGAATDPAEIARALPDLEKFAGVLDGHLARRSWVVGEQVTLADYALAAPLMYRERARLPMDAYPHLLAWFGRVQQLEAWQHTNPVW